jgi:hypothetical protein
MAAARLNLPPAPLEIAIELGEQAANDPMFADRIMNQLAEHGTEHGSYQDVIIRFAREQAQGDHMLEQRFITLGCILLGFTDRAMTVRDLENQLQLSSGGGA